MYKLLVALFFISTILYSDFQTIISERFPLSQIEAKEVSEKLILFFRQTPKDVRQP
jgi:hypothetical protein